jgi:hypothetical protein
MIVSHKYRFIFLKTSKTAGTSVEIALSRFCGPDDIATRVSDEDEVIRSEQHGWEAPLYPARFSQYSPVDWYRYAKDNKRKQYYYNHIPARKLKRRLSRQVWDSYFKFCIVRNPWDRVISQYHWRYRSIPEDQRPGIEAFLDSRHVRSLQRKGFQLYTIGGKPVVDTICRYESLAEDLEKVRMDLGLPDPVDLPQAKAGHRKDKRHYREILSDSARDRIAEMFREEIELMGYSF